MRPSPTAEQRACTVAALYVMPRGPYYGLPDVEPWGLPDKDARLYAGPWPVVAHPPCARWGRYWGGGPSARKRRTKGDDGGCFDAALKAVRIWGGVLEHPEGSWAWPFYRLHKPPQSGGWVAAGDGVGWTCCVAQGNYGHPAQKLTWLYVSRVPFSRLPILVWGRSPGRARLDQGGHSTAERRDREKHPRITAYECHATPIPFRDVLLKIAASCTETSIGRRAILAARVGPVWTKEQWRRNAEVEGDANVGAGVRPGEPVPQEETGEP